MDGYVVELVGLVQLEVATIVNSSRASPRGAEPGFEKHPELNVSIEPSSRRIT